MSFGLHAVLLLAAPLPRRWAAVLFVLVHWLSSNAGGEGALFFVVIVVRLAERGEFG